MTRWVSIVIMAVGSIAITAWIIAELIQLKPNRWKSLLKIVFGATCLTVFWLSQDRSGFDAGAAVFLGIITCAIGSAEMVVAMMKGQQSSEPPHASDRLKAPPEE